MRVLFVVAKLDSVEPFGIMSLVPFLQEDGHIVSLVEAEAPDIAQKVKAFNPDIAAYSVTTGAHDYYLELNRFLKAHSSFVSVFGGPHPTFFPEMINEDGVDAVCVGEGEHAMREFLRELDISGETRPVPNFTVKDRKGVVQGRKPRPPVPDLDRLPFPDREIYYSVSDRIRSYPVRSFLASRGCPYACSYCFNPVMDRLYDGAWKKVRVRSPENLVEEIRLVALRYPTEHVAFRESIFPLSIVWLERFKELYREKVGLPFYCHVRLDLIDERRAALLKEAGCYCVNVGVETGNPRLRAELLNRHMSNSEMEQASALLKKHGIKILANNMLGLPGATFENEMETLGLNQRCGFDYSLAMMWQPYPKTRLAEEAKRQGYFDGDLGRLDYSYYYESPIRFDSTLGKRRATNLQRLFALGSLLPAATPLIRLLTFLPPNRIFDAVFKTTYAVFHQTEIFPHRMSIDDWKGHLVSIMEAI